MLTSMIKTTLSVLLLLPVTALAVICKSVGEDGVVSYTDVPVGECQQEVKLPDYSRYAPRPIDQPAGNQLSPASGSVVQFVRYESIAIAQPKSGGIVRSNEGKVTVVVALEPALQPGHLVGLTIDGKAVKGAFGGTAIDLSGIDRGTHTLRANVSDADGRILISTAPVRFTLRKTGLTDSRAPDVGIPTPQPDPGFPAPEGSADFSPPANPGFGPGPDANFTPPASPGFAPPASPGFSPGGAFTPNFNRR